MLHHLQHTPRRLVSAATRWHVTSQQHARHNARVASAALAERRLEQLDVEDYLAGLDVARHDRHRRTAIGRTG